MGKNFFEEKVPEAKETLDDIAKRFGELSYVEELHTNRVRKLKNLWVFGEHSATKLYDESKITESEFYDYGKAIADVQQFHGTESSWYSWRYWMSEWHDTDTKEAAKLRNKFIEPIDYLQPPMSMDVGEYLKEHDLV